MSTTMYFTMCPRNYIPAEHYVQNVEINHPANKNQNMLS